MDNFVLFLILVGIVWWFSRSHWISQLIARKAKAQVTARQLPEEMYYEQAAREIAQNQIRVGLWAKAFAEANGNEALARARYIRLRVASLRREVAASVESALENTPLDGPNTSASDMAAAPRGSPARPARSGHGANTNVVCPACEGHLRVPAGKSLKIKCAYCGLSFERKT